MKYIRDISMDELPIPIIVDMSLRGDKLEYFRMLGASVREEIVDILSSMYGPSKLINTIKIIPRNDGVTISMEEYGKYLDEGTDGRYMLKHIGKSIPMEKDGEVTFRKVTAGSIAKGNWYNPGTKGLHFVEEAIDRTMEDVLGIIGWTV